MTGPRTGGRPHIITLGNEKGGSGKTTTSMHIIATLLKEGQRVGSIDLDSRQRSLTRYVENRAAWAEANGVDLVMPAHRVIAPSQAASRDQAEADGLEAFKQALDELSAASDFIVIDCPGHDTAFARHGHQVADTLVTPLNDSFVDLDLIARVDPQTYKLKGPSLYAEMVWEARKRRALADKGKIDWIVMRNRLSSLDAKNKRRVQKILDQLERRIGFRQAPGFGERVIFREMFPSGLTLLDLTDEGVEAQLSMSHIAARAEIRSLFDALSLPGLSAGAAHAAE